MSEVDDFSAPAQAPAAPANPLDEFSAPVGSSAKQRAAVFANESPDEAGKALSIAKQTGIPASVVQTDLPGYDAHAKTQAAKKAVENPAIASYIDQHPMAAKVSNDDYSVLDKISGFFTKLDPKFIDDSVSMGLAQGIPSIGELTGTQPGREKLRGYLERAREGFVGGFGDQSEVTKILGQARDMGLASAAETILNSLGIVPAARALEAAFRLPGGVIGAVAGLGGGLAEEGTGSSTAGDRAQRELMNLGNVLMIEGGMVRAEAPAIARPKTLGQVIGADDLHQFLAEHNPGGPRAQALSAGETPKDQLWQAKPVIDQIKAETAGAALDDAVQAAQESKTKQRSPELFEEYLKAHGDKGTVHVPAQSILDLYEKAGKVPMEGDGLFGWVPGIADKATLAAETGAEVKIPLAKYIANVDEAVHEGLKNVARVQENGVTREEAKAAVEEQKAKIEAFHGTPHDFESFDLSKIGTGEGAQVYGHGLYFAENRAVGEQYKRMLSDQISPLARGYIEEAKGDTAAALAAFDSQWKDSFPDVRKEIETGKPTNEGQLYKVHINADPTQFLDWDKPLSEQSQHVQNILRGMAKTPDQLKLMESGLPVGEGLKLGHYPGSFDINSPEFSKQYNEAGIPGIKYLDQGSRGVPAGVEVAHDALNNNWILIDKSTGDTFGTFASEAEAKQKLAGLDKQTRNFVVFDDKLVRIIEKNDNPIVQAVEAATEAAKASLGLRPLENYLTPLFKDGEAVNITKPEFQKYADLIDRAQEKVLEKAIALAKREASKRLTPEWKANEARTAEAVDGLLYNRPDFQADRFFNQGLMFDGKPVPKELRVNMGEIKADEYAPMFGFESGSEMVAAVLKLEQERADTGLGPKAQFNAHVKAETARQMEANYGHLADNIAIEASEAALAEYNVDLLATEWKMLAKLNGREPPMAREELAAWSKDQFDRSVASEVSYEQWRRAAEKGGREAEKALLKKDYVEAFNQKQKQMLSFLLAKEAKGFEKERAQAERLFDKYTSEVNLPAVDQAYTDQIHRQLQQFGIETKRTIENTDYNLQGADKDFSNFVAQKNANGDMIVQASLPRVPLDQLTVDQYRDFATMIKSLDNNGRRAMQIEIAGKREAFNEVIDKATKNLDTLEKNDFNPDERGVISGLRKLGRAVDSRLLKAEKLIDWIDKKDPLGAMNSSVLRGLIEGEQGKGDMITRLAKMAADLPGDRAWGKALNGKTNNVELLDWETGKPMQLTNENKIAIALNYGNKSNRRILLEGYRWKEHEVEAYLAREMSDMDKAFVDGIHGLFEPLAPLVEAATARRAGVAIPLIEGSSHNGMKGGYYPLMEDPRSKLIGQQVETDLFQKTKFDPLPTAPALKQRTGKVYPVDLSIGNIHARLSQTAHAVFMQEPVVNANKVLSAPAIREGVYKAFGPEYVEMLDKWIRDIANNGGSDVGFHDDMAAWISRNLRQNVTVQLMGWKASTALIHGGSAGASSVYELGKMDMGSTGGAAAKSFISAPVDLVKNIYNLGLGQFLPDASRRFFGSQSTIFDGIDFVQANSGEMRNRQRSLQKDFGFQLEKIVNKSVMDDAAQARAIHQTYSMAMVAYLDQLTATPVWRAAYDKALLHDGLEHADAVYVADKAVREAHGSASLVSRANIGRGEINKWLTIAYNGYWNHNYNKMREAGKEITGYDDSLSNGQRVAVGAAFMTAMIIAPALVHHAVRGDSTGHPGKDIAGALASQFAGTVPVVNMLTYSLMHNHDPSISPIDEVLKSVVHVGSDIVKGKEQKRDLRAFGYLTGLPPTNQAIDTFSFMNDVMQRRQDPKSPTEWARGLMTGKAQPKAH